MSQQGLSTGESGKNPLESQANTPIWYLVIQRERVGPVTAQDVKDRLQNGQITADTYIWRDGFGNWVKLGTTDEFGGLIAVLPVSKPNVSIVTPSPMSAASIRPSGIQAQNPTANQSGSMTGVRNENSVLFSLNNLQSLATAGEAAKQQAAKASAAPLTEGSGLIDIRTIASQTLAASTTPVPSVLGKPSEVRFQRPATLAVPAAPVLLSQGKSRTPSWMWGALIASGISLIGLITLMVIWVKNPDLFISRPENKPEVVKPVIATVVKPVIPEKSESVIPVKKPLKPETPMPAVKNQVPRSVRTRFVELPLVVSPPTSEKPVSDPPPVATKPERKPKKPIDDLDALLDGASPDGAKSQKPAADSVSGNPAMRETLSSQDRQAIMAQLKDLTRNCEGLPIGNHTFTVRYKTVGGAVQMSVTHPASVSVQQAECPKNILMKNLKIPPTIQAGTLPIIFFGPTR